MHLQSGYTVSFKFSVSTSKTEGPEPNQGKCVFSDRIRNRKEPHEQLKWEGLWRACDLTAFIHSSTGPVVHPFAFRHEGPGFNPQGVLMWNRDSPVTVVSLHWWPWRDWPLWSRLRQLRPEPSLGRRADNVIIPLDLTQLFCPSFTLTADPPSGFTTDMQFNWSSGPPVCSCHEGPGFNPRGGGGTYVKPGFSC